MILCDDYGKTWCYDVTIPILWDYYRNEKMENDWKLKDMDEMDQIKLMRFSLQLPNSD